MFRHLIYNYLYIKKTEILNFHVYKLHDFIVNKYFNTLFKKMNYCIMIQ
jgi:hypothetical protein